MISDKTLVQHLVYICEQKGLQHVVFSPGSRNASLVISFTEHESFHCITIPDERVAAFYALGMAQQLGQPVIIACTSGSAALNYAPAIAEAYYQEIPLLVITADRPVEWIDQRAGQTMRQQNVYANFIKKSFQLKQEAVHEDDLWYNDRLICEAIDLTMLGAMGPVHLNIPFREPLYETVDNPDFTKIKIVETIQPSTSLSEQELAKLQNEFDEYESKLILVGQRTSNDGLESILKKWLGNPSVVILTETTSNLALDGVHSCIDRFISSISKDDIVSYIPDLLITIGGAIVSKKVKALFRTHKPKAHWHINPFEHYIDTYQSLNKNIKTSPVDFFSRLKQSRAQNSFYKNHWDTHEQDNIEKHTVFLENCTWSDMKVFELIQNQLPSDSDLHLANSTPIRYNQLFDKRNDVRYYSNRGVSGIDGCTSTAIGAATGSQRLTTIVTGDLAFFYDSNALWNLYLPSQVVVIVMNNGGGGIFKIIPGPSGTKQYKEFFATEQSYSAEYIAKAYHCDYIAAEDEDSLIAALQKVYSFDLKKLVVLEVFTQKVKNEQILEAYFGALQ